MAQQINVDIELENGTRLSPFSSILIQQQIFGHHRFEVKVPVPVLEGTNASMINKSKDCIGKLIRITMAAKSGKKIENKFLGLVTEVGMEKYDNTQGDIVLRGYSPTIFQ